MIGKRLLLAASAALLLAGCGSITVPASGITSTGEAFYGQATASLSEGKFQVTNAAGVVCSGNYDPLDRSRELTVPFTCTDGRSGTIHIVRNKDLMGGAGTGVFSDGTTGEFKFGKDSGA
jgi:hypothetical protein